MGKQSYIILDEDLAPKLNKFAKTHKPKVSKKPLFKIASTIDFSPQYEIDTKQFKRIKEDMVLRQKLEKKAAPIHAKLLKDLERLISTCAASCQKKGQPTDKQLDELWKSMEAEIRAAGQKIQDDSFDDFKTYVTDRELGKAAKGRYVVKQVQGVLKSLAALAGTGLAVFSAVATLGATAPAVFAGAYGSYKAIRETFSAFKKAGRSLEEYAESIESTIEALKAKYDGLSDEERSELMGHAEARGKAAREFLGFTGQTIGKLEASIKGYDKAIQIGVYAVSRMGKQATKLTEDLQAARAKLNELDDELDAIDEDDADGTKELQKRVDATSDKIESLKKEIKQFIDDAETKLPELEDAKKESDDWKEVAKEMKDQRPNWVRHVSKPCKFSSLALAVASIDFNQAISKTAEALPEIGTALGSEVASFVNENKKKLKVGS